MIAHAGHFTTTLVVVHLFVISPSLSLSIAVSFAFVPLLFSSSLHFLVSLLFFFFPTIICLAPLFNSHTYTHTHTHSLSLSLSLSLTRFLRFILSVHTHTQGHQLFIEVK
ncbi:MAG: hypothetical protein JOS17DRAFT_488850 [Linnemannia elongata]|nr:MAG: hypothetical protein JOS17DRAFT_488850 [Linnemannia elongata]